MVKLGPFFENLSNRGPTSTASASNFPPSRALSTLPDVPSIVSPRRFQPTFPINARGHRACNPRPLSLFPPRREQSVASLWQDNRGKKPVSGRGRRERCEPREESRGGTQGGPPSPPSSEERMETKGRRGGKGRGQQKPRTLRACSLR